MFLSSFFEESTILGFCIHLMVIEWLNLALKYSNLLRASETTYVHNFL